MSARRRLIVGSAGGTNAFGAIRSVRDRYGDRVFVVAIDTNPREHVAATVLSDAFVQVPPARSPEFIVALRDLAHSYPGACYLPLHDDEIQVAAHLAFEERLPSGLELIAPPFGVVRLCSDKWQMHQWLAEKGFRSPRTHLATPAAFRQIGSPAMLKPREGTGSQGVRLIRDGREIADLDPNRWLLQEQLQGPETAIDVFLSRRTGAFVCACREYIEVRATVAMKVRVHSDPVLERIAENLACTLPLHGGFMFQVMRDSTGQWTIIDVNPRIGSGTRMCAVLGLDFAAANLADFWGEPVDAMLRPLSEEHYVVRQYADYDTGRP